MSVCWDQEVVPESRAIGVGPPAFLLLARYCQEVCFHVYRCPKSMDAIMSLCKRRGFVYQASEIYGGINGFWDYGLLSPAEERTWRSLVAGHDHEPRVGPEGTKRRTREVRAGGDLHHSASQGVGGEWTPCWICRSNEKVWEVRHSVRADQLWDIITTGSDWFASLIQEFEPAPEGTQDSRN